MVAGDFQTGPCLLVVVELMCGDEKSKVLISVCRFQYSEVSRYSGRGGPQHFCRARVRVFKLLLQLPGPASESEKMKIVETKNFKISRYQANVSSVACYDVTLV